MKAEELQSELHKIIDQVQDEEVLLAVRTLLNSQVMPLAYAPTGEPLTKADVDRLLQVSEEDIQYNRVIDHQELKKEIQTWRKKYSGHSRPGTICGTSMISTADQVAFF